MEDDKKKIDEATGGFIGWECIVVSSCGDVSFPGKLVESVLAFGSPHSRTLIFESPLGKLALETVDIANYYVMREKEILVLILEE